MPLYTKEAQPNFPIESNGTKRVRYPGNVYVNSAPSSTALVSGSASIVPFYLNQGISGFQALSGSIGNTTGGPWGIKVGLYSADSGLLTASLIESLSLSVSGSSSSRTATFVGAGTNLGEGWYILSAFWDGTGGTINNTGLITVNNGGILGSAGVSGTYLASHYKVTGLSSNPANLSGVTTSTTLSDSPFFFPYY